MNEWLITLEPWLAVARSHAQNALDAAARLPPWVPYAVIAVAILGWLRAWVRARRGERGLAAARVEAANWQTRYEKEAMWRSASLAGAERLDRA